MPANLTLNVNGGGRGVHSDGFDNGSTDGSPGGSISLYVPIQNPNYETNLDKDTTLSSCDIDADNDGIPDIVESLGTDTNGDDFVDDYNAGTGSFAGTDGDSDGWSGTYDGNAANNGGGGATPTIATNDSDNDGYPEDYPTGNFDGDTQLNHLDLDADDDGIQDILESGGADTNGDGFIDNYNPTTGLFLGAGDADNDGFSSLHDDDTDNDGTDGDAAPMVETGADITLDGRPNSYPNANKDALSYPNFLDRDSDDDGITDVVENAGGLVTLDNPSGDLDGAIGVGGITDGNSNGWHNPMEGRTTVLDTDSDGVADPYDIDADNDGIVDYLEGTCTTCPNFTAPVGPDTDLDGILDSYETLTALNAGGGSNQGLTPNEDDDDGTAPADYLDFDSDNDTGPDWAEGYDTNGDSEAGPEIIAMAATYLGNGGPATDYPTTDTDGDGLPDWLDNLVGFGYTSATPPPFLNPASSFWHDRDNDGLVDLFDNNIQGQAYNGVGAPLPDNNAANDRDWRDVLNFSDLPIELLSFTAEKKGENESLLRWVTATEQGSDYIVVEHSPTGVDFQPIGEVEAMGYSTTETNYSFVHPNPVVGDNYYRLQLMDEDRSFEYSEIRVVRFEDWGTIRLYPNPATSQTTLELDRPLSEDTPVRLIDELGRTVLSTTLVKGQRSVQLEVSQLPSAMYTVELQQKDQPKYFKLLKTSEKYKSSR